MKIALTNTALYAATYAAICALNGKIINPVKAIANINQWPSLVLLLTLLYGLILIHQLALTISLNQKQLNKPVNYHQRELQQVQIAKIKQSIYACIIAKFIVLVWFIFSSIK